MAVVNLLKSYENNARRSGSVAVGTFKPAETTTNFGVATNGVVAVGDIVQFAKLPEDVVITDAYIVCKVPSNQATAQLKVKVGGADIVAPVAVGNQGDKVLGSLIGKIYRSTVSTLEVEVSVAAISSGEFDIVVHYNQLDKITGEYTKTA